MTLCPAPRAYCAECGDGLIHNGNRGPHESSSAFGQHIHDTYPQEFYAIDIDSVIYKLRTHVLRVIEHKDPAKPLKSSQMSILPLLSIGIDLLVKVRVLNEQSGVFVVWSAPPFTTGTVARIHPGSAYAIGETHQLDAPQFDQFKQGLIVS